MYLNENKIVIINKHNSPNKIIGIHLFNPSLNNGIIKNEKTKQEPMSGCKKIKNTGVEINNKIFSKSLFFD